jgi:hypothetical protein
MERSFDLDVMNGFFDSLEHVSTAEELFTKLHQVGDVMAPISDVFLQLEGNESDCL